MTALIKCLPVIVTVNESVAILAAASTAVYVTVVAPREKVSPGL